MVLLATSEVGLAGAGVVGNRTTAVEMVLLPVDAVARGLPMVATLVGHVHRGTSLVEDVSVGIAAVDAEAPRAGFPRERTIEVVQRHILFVLPGVQHVLQVGVATVPPDAEHIVASVHAHQVVEVNLIHGVVLRIGEIQFVCHLIAEEEGFVLCH